jgi:hypothetical protein
LVLKIPHASIPRQLCRYTFFTTNCYFCRYVPHRFQDVKIRPMITRREALLALAAPVSCFSPGWASVGSMPGRRLSAPARPPRLAMMAKKFDKKYDDAFDDFRTSGRSDLGPRMSRGRACVPIPALSCDGSTWCCQRTSAAPDWVDDPTCITRFAQHARHPQYR